MALSFLYLLTRRLIGMLVGSLRGEHAKDVEIADQPAEGGRHYDTVIPEETCLTKVDTRRPPHLHHRLQDHQGDRERRQPALAHRAQLGQLTLDYRHKPAHAEIFHPDRHLHRADLDETPTQPQRDQLPRLEAAEPARRPVKMPFRALLKAPPKSSGRLRRVSGAREARSGSSGSSSPSASS
jgi:hypothetical protein